MEDEDIMYRVSSYSEDEWKTVLKSKNPEDKELLNSMVLEILEVNDDDVFRRVLELGYTLPVMNEKGQTALHIAFYIGLYAVCRVILEYLETYELESADCYGLEYFHIACFYSTEKIVEKFIKQGADVNRSLHVGPNIRYSGFTPLHFAVLNCWAEAEKLVEILLTEGADENATEGNGRTPFHIICCFYDDSDCDESDDITSVQFMEILLKENVDVNATDWNGNTPLLNIFPQRYEEFDRLLPWLTQKSLFLQTQQKLDFLLSHGADVTAVNYNGENILHRVFYMANFFRFFKDFSFNDEFVVGLLKKILECNPALDINAKNKTGESLLTLAMLSLSPDIIEFLLDNGADVTNAILEPDADFDYYPNVVPNLETLQSVFKILDLLLDKGLTLKLGDDLAILKFLIHNETDCLCVKTNTDSFLASPVIYFGSETHVKHVFDEYAAKSNMRNLSKIQNYVYLMKTAGLYLDPQVEASIEKYLSNFTFPPLSPDVVIEVDAEWKKLKTIKLNDNVSLYDLLLKHHSENIKYFRDNVSNVELFENLNHYEDIVKGHITKALIRDFFMKTARLYLKNLLIVVPDLCCDLILRFLPNEDILNMCLALLEE